MDVVLVVAGLREVDVVLVVAGLRAVDVVLVVAGLREVEVVRCTVVVLPELSVCLIVVRVVPFFFTRLSIVVCTAGLRVVFVLVVVCTAGLRVVLVLVVVCVVGLRVVLVLVVVVVVVFVAGLRAVVVVVVCVAGWRVEVPLCVEDGLVVVVASLLVCARSSPALRTLTPEPFADTRLSKAYSGCW